MILADIWASSRGRRLRWESLLAEPELRRGSEAVWGKVSCQKLRPRGGGDHSGVVGRERKRRKGDRKAAAVALSLKTAAKLRVCGHATGDDDAACTERLGCSEGLTHQVADDGVLERRDQIERLLVA